MADVQTVPGAAVVGSGDAAVLDAAAAGGITPGPHYLPPEPMPWRLLMDLSLIRLNVTADPNDHSRYALTGYGWAALVGAAWLFLRRRRASEEG